MKIKNTTLSEQIRNSIETFIVCVTCRYIYWNDYNTYITISTCIYMYEFYVCSHYVPEVQYTLSADTILTGQGKTRRVNLYNGTTNHNGVYMSGPIDVQLDSQKCDIIYARVTVCITYKLIHKCRTAILL